MRDSVFHDPIYGFVIGSVRLVPVYELQTKGVRRRISLPKPLRLELL